MIFGQADENGLTAPFLGQEEFSRSQIGMHGYGMGSMEVIDGTAKGFFHRAPPFEYMIRSEAE